METYDRTNEGEAGDESDGATWGRGRRSGGATARAPDSGRRSRASRATWEALGVVLVGDGAGPSGRACRSTGPALATALRSNSRE